MAVSWLYTSSMATLGAENIQVVLPDGVSEDAISITSGEEGNSIIVATENVSGLEITASGEVTALTGKKFTDTKVSVEGSRGDTTNVVIENTVFKDGTIANEGKGSIEVNLNTGKIKGLTIDAGNKKRDDLVRVKDDVKLIKATMDMGKGNDTVRFGKNMTFKGKSTLDLGKGGKDAVILEADNGSKNKLTITNVTKKDTITVGDETFTGKEIAKGAEVPGVKVELA